MVLDDHFCPGLDHLKLKIRVGLVKILIHLRSLIEGFEKQSRTTFYA